MKNLLLIFALIALNLFPSSSRLNAKEILTVKKFLIDNGILRENYGYRAEEPTICRTNSNCYPGQCLLRNGLNTCHCPEGYYSDRGICKEFQWNCQMIDCKPGKCVNEFSAEKCLCPEGYTSTAGRCIEITHTSSGQLSTIMLMIVIAMVSVVLTTFLGVCICYYTYQSNQG